MYQIYSYFGTWNWESTIDDIHRFRHNCNKLLFIRYVYHRLSRVLMQHDQHTVMDKWKPEYHFDRRSWYRLGMKGMVVWAIVPIIIFCLHFLRFFSSDQTEIILMVSASIVPTSIFLHSPSFSLFVWLSKIDADTSQRAGGTIISKIGMGKM